MPDGLTGAPPRLLLTTDAVGGVWRYTLDLARGLSNRGIEPVLAVLGPAPGAAQRSEAGQVPRLRLVQTGLPLDWTADNPADLAHTTARLSALAALVGATSIHLHAPALVGETSWPAPVAAVHHSCVGTWWQAVRGGNVPEDFAWRIQATAHGLRDAHATVAPTAAHADAIRAVYGDVDITIIHNGTLPSPPPFTGRAGGGAPARDCGHESRKAILAAGRLWDEGKRAALLDEAAKHLPHPIRAAGPTRGPNGAEIHLPNLHLLGSLTQEAMAHEYATTPVFASLAAYEPFGLAVLEAAQAGMRLVLADIPTFRELWDGAATFVTDPADLPHALQQALDTPGDGGASERAGRYTIDATVSATLALHRALVSAA